METGPGEWRVRVYVGPDPITKKPRQIERTVRGGRGAAEGQRRRLEHEVTAGKHGGTKGSVAQLLDTWLERHRSMLPTSWTSATRVPVPSKRGSSSSPSLSTVLRSEFTTLMAEPLRVAINP